jgi:uncharacterized protein (TIGR02453 family)
MVYFTADFFNFFEELSENNSKIWMDAHKKKYEEAVKLSFRKLVSDFLERIYEVDPAYPTQKAENCIFRINRDIRFSANKVPYKNHTAAYFCRDGKKSESPGFYIHFGAEECFVGGGCYALSARNLKKLRQKIASKPEELFALIEEPRFKQTYGEIQGQKNKTLPQDLQALAKQLPLLYNKQFYFSANLSRDQILAPRLLEELTELYCAASPLIQYLRLGFID